MHRKIFYFLLILSLFPMLLQAGTRGRIKGKVVDLQTGEALIGASVTVVGTTAGSATDASGEFLVQNLEAGVYTIRASYLGYQTITISNIRVNADLTAYVDIELPSEDIQVGTVEIVAQKPLIQKDNTNAVRITNSEDIEALPVRGVNNIVTLTAGVTMLNGNISIRGGRVDEVGYYLDGVSIASPNSGVRAVTLSQDAIEEIQVQAGGYTAEFGGANAGIISQSLRSGGNQFHASLEYITDNLAFKGRDDFNDGEKNIFDAYQYGYNELSTVFSGPLFNNKIKFFLNMNYLHRRDTDLQEYPGINVGVIGSSSTQDTVNLVYPAGPRLNTFSQSYTLAGTLNFDLNPILIRLSGTFSNTLDTRGTGQIADMFNPRRALFEGTNGAYSLKITHVISPTMFYEITGGVYSTTNERYDEAMGDNWQAYGDSVANAAAGWVWNRSALDLANDSRHGRYVLPYQPNVMGYTFESYGYPENTYTKNSTFGLSGNVAFNWIANKYNTIKLGGEYKTYTIRNWAYANQFSFAKSYADALTNSAYAGMSDDEIKSSIIAAQGASVYGYDFLGNETDEDGWLAPHKPVFASAYMTDKVEYEDVILNLGLRYDYIDVDNLMMIDPENPQLSLNANTGSLIESGWTEVPSFSAVSPRLGMSFPITDKTMFHAQFGKFVQQTRLNDLYQGYSRIAYELRQSYAFLAAVGSNVRPTRTTQYELGFTQQVTDFLSFDITGYYKDIKDNVIFTEIEVSKDASILGNYYTLVNGDYATTKGLEFSVTMRRYQRIALNASLALQDARGTGSNPYTNTGIVGAPIDKDLIYTPKFIEPLDYNYPVKANLNIDYRFGENDGPAILHDFGVSLLIKYNSGHPYTRGEGVQNLENDSRGRYPLESLNSSMTPSFFQVDFKIDKSFTIFDKLAATVYLRVINLFNTKNQINVYSRTGSADDDGVLSDPRYGQAYINEYGSRYADVYRAINLGYQTDYFNATGNLLYGEARQVHLGIRLEY
jgi:hypothetical protein